MSLSLKLHLLLLFCRNLWLWNVQSNPIRKLRAGSYGEVFSKLKQRLTKYQKAETFFEANNLFLLFTIRYVKTEKLYVGLELTYTSR